MIIYIQLVVCVTWYYTIREVQAQVLLNYQFYTIPGVALLLWIHRYHTIVGVISVEVRYHSVILLNVSGLITWCQLVTSHWVLQKTCRIRHFNHYVVTYAHKIQSAQWKTSADLPGEVDRDIKANRISFPSNYALQQYVIVSYNKVH
jgi:hypothetical protein